MKKYFFTLQMLLFLSVVSFSQPFGNDIQMLSINCPNGNYYYGSELQYPSFTVKNTGINQINEINVYYSIDENEEILRNLTNIALQTGQTRNVLFPEIELIPGTHSISARVEIVGADDEFTNDNFLESTFSFGGEDIGICQISGPDSDYCGIEQPVPAVWVKNYSDIDISSFTVSYRLDFYPVVSIDVTETIAPGDSILVVFDAVTISSGNHAIQFICSAPNGNQDSNTANNSMSLSFDYSNGKHILISILTDNFGSETSWDLKNSMNQLIAHGSGYSSNTLYEHNLCLSADCFTFTIYDSYGDGMCGSFGTGYYKIEDVDGEEIIITGCDFTTSATANFCIETPPGPPVANFSHSDVNNCTGTVNFYDNSNCNPAAVSWLWNFGDGTTSDEQNPVHTYAMNGSYNVSMQVTNSSGTSSLTIPNSVLINKEASPFIADEHFCYGENVSFFAPEGTDQLYWYATPYSETPLQIGSNISFANLTNDTIVYYESGSEPQISNVGLTDNTGAGGYFSFSIDRAVYFDAISEVTIKSATVYASGAATRTITLKNSGGTVLDTRVINIPDGESIIDLDFQVPAGEDYAIHVNTANNLSYTGDYGGPDVGYPFTVPDLISFTGNNYSNSFWYFFYNIEVQAGSGSSCITARTPLTAIMSPQTVSLGNDTTICNGNSFYLSPETEYSGYLWNTGSEEPSIEISESGNYLVTVTDEYSCTADGSVNITVSEELVLNEYVQHPSAVGSNDGSIEIEIISGSEPYEIIWSNSSTDFVIGNLAPGYYSYTITDNENCTHTGSVEIFSSVQTSVENKMSVNIYPNPAKDILTVKSEVNGSLQIILYDLNSKELINTFTKSPETELNIEGIKPGVYILNIKGSGFTTNQKIIKE